MASRWLNSQGQNQSTYKHNRFDVVQFLERLLMNIRPPTSRPGATRAWECGPGGGEWRVEKGIHPGRDRYQLNTVRNHHLRQLAFLTLMARATGFLNLTSRADASPARQSNGPICDTR